MLERKWHLEYDNRSYMSYTDFLNDATVRNSVGIINIFVIKRWILSKKKLLYLC